MARRSLDISCIATSPGAEDAARQPGILVESFGEIENFDIAIDEANQIAPWLVKGRGVAHSREKLAAAGRIVVIAALEARGHLRGPVPLEFLSFGLRATIHRIRPVNSGMSRSAEMVV